MSASKLSDLQQDPSKWTGLLNAMLEVESKEEADIKRNDAYDRVSAFPYTKKVKHLVIEEIDNLRQVLLVDNIDDVKKLKKKGSRYHLASLAEIQEISCKVISAANANGRLNPKVKEIRYSVKQLASFEEQRYKDSLNGRFRITKLILELWWKVWHKSTYDDAKAFGLAETLEGKNNVPPIIVAAKNFNGPRFRQLLKYQVNVNVSDGHFKTVLHHIANDKRRELSRNDMRAALEAGANPWLSDDQERFPIEYAVEAGRLDLVETLVDSPIKDKEFKCSKQKALDEALFIACRQRDFNIKIIKVLNKAGGCLTPEALKEVNRRHDVVLTNAVSSFKVGADLRTV